MAKTPGKVTVKKSGVTAKSASDAAYGKREVIYEKPKKPVKDLNSPDYQGLTKEQRNTKYYSSTSDAANGKMTETFVHGFTMAKRKMAWPLSDDGGINPI